MGRGTIQYRGSLKSCNYSCSYCPFAKRKSSTEELARDRESWFRFCDTVEKTGDIYGAVMVVPYGEALIHICYWEGLARLSRLDTVEAVGAQTNLSFPVEKMLNEYRKAGGRLEKLRLWATFHPEMVTVEDFTAQCKKLSACGVQISAGAVGVPDNIEILKQLRKSLPDSIYLWINRMDGLKRRYTPEEEKSMKDIDPLFSQELHWPKANPSQCRDRIFVEADGSFHLCNIGEILKQNWYDNPAGPFPDSCSRARCSCYLAYGGRADFANKAFFGRYPAFRIPWKPKAVFLDLDGTLLPENPGEKIRKEWSDYIRQEDSGRKLFLATSLPEKEALTRCPEIVPYLSGGVFAAGAHVVLYGDSFRDGGKSKNIPPVYEEFHCFDAPWLPLLSASGREQREQNFRVRSYLHDGKTYKVTLVKPARRGWGKEEIAEVAGILPSGGVRIFVERGCLQIVASKTDKGVGIRRLCSMIGISPSETAAVGNSSEDIPMFQVCGFGVAVAGSPEWVKEAADMVAGRL